jgi:hypothetical protein
VGRGAAQSAPGRALGAAVRAVEQRGQRLGFNLAERAFAPTSRGGVAVARLKDTGSLAQAFQRATPAEVQAAINRPFASGGKIGRDIFREAREVIAGAGKLSPQQKAEAFEAIAKRINEIDPSWSATRGPSTNAVGLFTGETRPFGLAVDPAGRVWQTANVAEGTTLGKGGALTADYSKWTQIRPGN